MSEKQNDIIINVINEANIAADMVLSTAMKLTVPVEVIEAAEKTSALAHEISLAISPSITKLNEYNWRMHIICSKLYLNIQRVSRDEREQFADAIAAYKMMMYHYSMGQMEIAPVDQKQLLVDMGHHAQILQICINGEVNRLVTACLLEQKSADELLPEIDKITSMLIVYLQRNSLLDEAITNFYLFTNNLKRIAKLLGELGDPLDYLAEEYDFFTNKIGEMASL